MRLSVSPASGRLSRTTNTACALVVCGMAAMLVGLLAIPSTVGAQAVTGTLLGNVTDASGAAVPGATVTAIETQTNISRTAVSNEAGNYIFSSLKNGTYSVEAELQGFRKVIRQNVRVDVNTTMRVDLKLELGQLTEAVTVAAETPLLQTDRTDTGRLLESKIVTEIPLGFNRNFQGLLVTVPGATRPFRPHSQFFNSQDSLSTEVNGQPRMANNTLIEGLDNNQKTGLLSVIIPAADALETVSVSTSNYDAEFGRSGGAITNVTLKSGTNDFKGSVFFFGNTESTNASDYATGAAAALPHLKPPTKFAQGGFTLGGPIVRNKFFFFGDYQRTIDNLGYVVRATIPTMAMRNGDFSAVPTGIYDPTTGAVNGTGRTAFANNQIPQNRISPIARRLLALHSRTEHRRRAARPEQLSEVPDPRKDDRCLRHEAELLDEREESAVGPSELPAPGGLRPGPLRRVRRGRKRRIRRHGHQHQREHGGKLDACVQQHDGHGRSRRRELLPQRHLDRGQRADDQHGRRHPGREHRRVHQRPVPDQHGRLLRPGAGVLREPAVGSVGGDLEHRDDGHQAGAQSHREARGRVAAQPRHAAANAGRRRAQRQLQVRLGRHGAAERGGDAQRASPIPWPPSCSTGRAPCSATSRSSTSLEHSIRRCSSSRRTSGRPGRTSRSTSVCVGSTTRHSTGLEGAGSLSNYDPATNTLRVAGYGTDERIGRRQKHVQQPQRANRRLLAAERRHGASRRIRREHDSVSGQPLCLQLPGQAELLGNGAQRIPGRWLDGHGLPGADAGQHPAGRHHSRLGLAPELDLRRHTAGPA